MNISLNDAITGSTERPSSQQKPATPAQRAPAASTRIAKKAESQTPAEVTTTAFETNVTFRRDASGRIYYVVADAKSGKEIQQVPAEEVRKVGENIAKFIEQEQANAHPHLEIKA